MENLNLHIHKEMYSYMRLNIHSQFIWATYSPRKECLQDFMILFERSAVLQNGDRLPDSCLAENMWCDSNTTF